MTNLYDTVSAALLASAVFFSSVLTAYFLGRAKGVKETNRSWVAFYDRTLNRLEEIGSHPEK